MVREIVKKQIEGLADWKYDKALNEKSVSFDRWIREKESGLERFDMSFDVNGNDFDRNILMQSSFAAKYKDVTVRIIPYTHVNGNFKVSNYIEDILIFVNGELTDKAIPLLAKKFSENPDLDVCYGDEDIAEYDDSENNRYGRSIEGTRRNPYFKPEWSPNTFLDHFYFCNVVAVRRASLRDMYWDNELVGAEAIYNVLLRYIFSSEKNLRKSVDSVKQILVHAKNYELSYLKDRSAYTYAESVFAAEKVNDKIAVVIPSKDNPVLISKCLKSLYEYNQSMDFEIIVVDNGSGAENKNMLERLSRDLKFTYVYEPGEFNFAAMINYGVENTTADCLLLLNDDITFTHFGCLSAMLRQAKLSFTGAVGIKLLYPESTMIQHAGVINNRLGPVHKLQFQDDEDDHYNGFNRGIQNVSAVTAACLMVRREVFNRVKGMNESLRVAFNDVDFCFKVMEAGFVNVVVNSFSAEHAESVTRGKDTDERSIKRLLSERDRLYTLHPALKNYDPYYSENLLSDCLDVRIIGAHLYEYEKAIENVGNVKKQSLGYAREDQCVRLSVEYAGDMSGFSYKEEDKDYYLIQGFSYVTGSDNACYSKKLLLYNEAERVLYAVDYAGALRTDVYEACRDERNVALSGFCLKVLKSQLPKGEYRVGVLYSRVMSKEKLYIYSNKYLESYGD